MRHVSENKVSLNYEQVAKLLEYNAKSYNSSQSL